MLSLFLLSLPLLAAEQAPGLVALRPFTLESAVPHLWHAEQRPYDQGVVLVLSVDPDLARPRQGPHPVLYVGDTPAERLSWSATAPYLVVLAPGPLDLASTPVFWGDDTLPERVDAQHGAAQRAASVVAPFSPEQLAAATGPALAVSDQAALYRAVAPIVAQYAPQP